jgi:hypothetical protein
MAAKAAAVQEMPVTPDPPHSVVVVYHDGLLTVTAENATLSEIMSAVGKATGAKVETLALAEPVSERLGPQAPAAVIAALLQGSHLNYVIVGDVADSNAIRAIQITAEQTVAPSNSPPIQRSDEEAQAALAKSLFVAQTGGDEGVWDNEPQPSAPLPASVQPDGPSR